VLNPGSNEYGRRWPLENYLVLATWIKNRGLKAVFVGKADERATGNAIAELADNENIFDLTGQTDVPGLLDLMQGAALVVSNDTGPAHLSVGLGTATVVIIGGGHFGSFVPYPAEITPDNVRFVYHKMDCYHCFWRCPKRADRFASFPCVAGVTLSQVEEQCSQLLKPGVSE
jgi:ADP-heptose:LPS heptosyltransferase